MIRISEIFGPTVQGEGPLIGKPTIFVRTGGCDYRCSWCDTLYAVLPENSSQWEPLEPKAIMDRVRALSADTQIMITLSGGNPAMHDLEQLIDLGKSEGFNFAMETQGSIARAWFENLDWLFLSHKPPSSGEEIDWSKFNACVESGSKPQLSLKVAIFDDADYMFAKAAAARYPDIPVYLQVGNPVYPAGQTKYSNLAAELTQRYQWLVEKASRDRWFTPTILPQLHVLVWGTEAGH